MTYEDWILRMSPELPGHVRPSTLKAIYNYAYNGVPTGDFLRAVIANNLSKAIARADDDNLHNLRYIVGIFYNYTPADCWGSQFSFDAWLAERKEHGTLI